MHFSGWYDFGAWARNLLIAWSTVCLNTWLAIRISKKHSRRAYAQGYEDGARDIERYRDIEKELRDES